MKHTFYVIAMTLLATVTTFAQQDTTRFPTPQAMPQGQYGTQEISDTLNIKKEDRVEVAHDAIPPAMKQELDENPAYTGWESGNVFFERNTSQYIVHIKKGNTTHTYRFDREGNAIRTDQMIQPEETKH
ncbi:MAG TPA: hypothetical protein VKZ68_06925 [Ohtaekwangia sp.]|nr:hypothetical protein [Ohtaekwangia sp.]